MEWPRLATYVFATGSDTVEAIPEPGVPYERIEDVYTRSVLPMVLQASGHETLHASAISTGRGVLGFCGGRGVGKSTIAYGLAHRGFRQHSDDTLVMEIGRRGIAALGLPFVRRLRQPSAEFFGVGSDSRHADSVAVPAPAREDVRAIFVLQRAEQHAGPVVVRLSAAAAFGAVLAHANCFNPDDLASRRRLLMNYLELSARVPVFEVRFQTGLDRLDLLLDRLLASAEIAQETAPRARLS